MKWAHSPSNKLEIPPPFAPRSKNISFRWTCKTITVSINTEEQTKRSSTKTNLNIVFPMRSEKKIPHATAHGFIEGA